jgi:Rha family phage regulatory protein
MSKEFTETIRAVFQSAGIPVELHRGGKHPFFVWQAVDGSQRKTFFPESESDWRSVRNAVADAKKQIRDAGYVQSAQEAAPDALVSLRDGQSWCSSLTIAEKFSRHHRDVLRSIDKIREECGTEFDLRNFAQVSYRDQSNREYRAYDLSRDAFTLVAMGFTGSEATTWKIRYIKAFNAMEAEISAIAARQIEARRDEALRADLDALTEIVLSLPPPAQPKRRPVINPIIAIRQMRDKRRARREARARA